MMELDSSLMQVIQLSTAPDMMPGSIMRAVTVKKVFIGDTPRFIDASSINGSI